MGTFSSIGNYIAEKLSIKTKDIERYTDPYLGDGLVQIKPNLYYLPKDHGLIRTKGWQELRSHTVSVASDGAPGTIAPTVTTIQCLNKYRSWVYDCVNLIAGSLCDVNYYLYEEVGEPNDEEFNRILSHPLLKLLRDPNKFMTGDELFEVTQKHLDLTGMAFWWIIRNGAGIPAELHVLNPHELVDIKLGQNTSELIKSFVFSSQQYGSIRQEIPFDDVVYFKYPHPANPLVPCAPVQAAAHASDLDLYLQVYEKDFFTNNARPDYIIVAEDAHIDTKEAERISEAVQRRHRGPGKQHKPIVLTAGMKIEQLSLSAKDFEFMALSEWTKDHILATFAVPEAMLGLFESFNKASSITAETVFVKRALNWRLRKWESALNKQLLPQFKGTDALRFKFDSALPKDDEWEFTKDQGELTMGLTSINEVRKRQGKKPFPSPICDVPLLNGAPIPGVSKEADDLWLKSQTALMSGGMGAGGAMPGALPPGMGGAIPQATPEAMSSAPQAQGVMGQFGGRPPGTTLSSLLQEGLRASRPGLSMLLNAARGKRGGLAALLEAHPEMHTISEALNRNRGEGGVLTRLLQKEIYEYIAKEYCEDEEDAETFKMYEESVPDFDELMDEYKEESNRFYVQKGVQFSELVTKALDGFVTKETFDDISEDDIKQDYMISAKSFADRAVKIGFCLGVLMVEKGVGESQIIDDPNKVAQEAAGRFLERSATLKAKSVRRELSKIVREGLESGESVQNVAAMIQKKFADLGEGRATLIATTEMAGAMDVGVDASFEKINQQAGKIIVEKAVVWTSLDERVCRECDLVSKKVVKDYRTGKDDFQYFYKGKTKTIELPLHPRCRCVRKAVFAKK